LFHKYLLNVSRPEKPINYININNYLINKDIKYYLHIHCFDLEKLEEYFGLIINNYFGLYGIIITYSNGEIINKYKNNVIWLKIINKGADIGGKICAINYLQTNNYDYKFILFLHSKTDQIDRENYLKPFENRAELIINLMESSNPVLDVIFPDYHNIVYNTKNNFHSTINRHIIVFINKKCVI
jgi:hypothetical protein